ncbi:gliding motility lipoprotein GldD [Draconibacterium sediminis]|uniref:Gliding motility protein GldD n=1 Tax=Draconibacterium sediminis TaxID=1544798 RepID=A0A0D8J7A0_9BACT|nr:gliding motility lipoprotein GldD [Draconibacterium sediminis]KJF42747.1 gliding motility protein GldD [Draconibacterium sediminis]
MRFAYTLFLLLFLVACKEDYTPKPRGYYRIDFPEKSYKDLNRTFPYDFEIPEYARIEKDSRNRNEPYWINVAVPENKVEIHISYYELNSPKDDYKLLAELMEETRTLAYKHSIKADAIDERLFMNPTQKVYGTIYSIEGNAASPMQFFLTDSTRHFLRGAFYIREVPDIDSLSPVINFIEPDVIHMIETTSWK